MSKNNVRPDRLTRDREWSGLHITSLSLRSGSASSTRRHFIFVMKCSFLSMRGHALFVLCGCGHHPTNIIFVVIRHRTSPTTRLATSTVPGTTTTMTMMTAMRLPLLAALAVALNAFPSLAFAPLQYHSTPHHDVVAKWEASSFSSSSSSTSVVVLHAGGFEWEDPTESFDQGVENPFKNTDLMNSEEGLKIDPARLLGPRLNGANLYLIGMMGSGKSAVGDVVARRMGTYNFLDTDAIIEKATNMTIPDIFNEEGEEGFRNVESQILDSVHSYVRCVVSTGGGLVCKLENWAKLQTGVVIWLDVDPELIMERIEGTDRPLLQTENPLQTLKDLLEERTEKYSQADVRIEVTADMDEEAVATAIVRELHDFIDNNPPAWKMAKAKAQSEGLDWVK